MDPITMAMLGSAGANLVSGGLGYLGSQSAGRAQAQAAQTSGLFGLIAQQQAQQQAREMAERGAAAAGDYYGKGRTDLLEQARQGEAAGREFYGQGVGFQEPYMQAGAGATNQLAALFGQGGAYTQQPTMAELQMDPGYAFRFQQGEQAMRNAARSGGLAGSGGALKAATRYGQEAGSQEYTNAYNRFMANRAAATQGLQNLAGTGAGAAGTATGLAGQIGSNLMGQRFGAGANLASTASNAGATTAGAYTGAIPTMAALTSANPYGQAMENVGQARASSYMGGAGALGQALNTIPQNYMTYSILNRMQPQTAAATQAASAAPMQLPGAVNLFGLY